MRLTFEKKIGLGFLVTILINIITVTAFAVRLSERQEQHSLTLAKHEATLDAVSTAANDFRAFEKQGPRFTGESAKLLKSETVAEAVAMSTAQTAKLEQKIDALSTQIVELKIILARQAPIPRQ